MDPRRHFAYLRYVLRHKWYTFLECARMGLRWRGLIHDWDKFLPRQWFPYARHFFEYDGAPKKARDETGYYDPATGDGSFDSACFLHLKRSRHHWQFWCLARGGLMLAGPDITLFPMDVNSYYEMVADWRGAARAQGTASAVAWYEANSYKLRLHPETREAVERLLELLEQQDNDIGETNAPEVVKAIPGNWLARLLAKWEEEKTQRLWAESNEAAIAPILENANEHKGLWEDRGDAYWLARLTMEVGDLGMTLADAHALPPDVILVMIGGIVTNWLRHRSTRQGKSL